jgi:hypothetical protein
MYWSCYERKPKVPKTQGNFQQNRMLEGYQQMQLYIKHSQRSTVRGCIQTFPNWVDNEINNNNKHSLRSNTKGYGGKTH